MTDRMKRIILNMSPSELRAFIDRIEHVMAHDDIGMQSLDDMRAFAVACLDLHLQGILS